MISLLQFALGLAGALFGAGVIYATLRSNILKNHMDLNGIAKAERDNQARNERRWLFDIADDVESAETEKQRTRLAERIRQDAYRK